VSKAHSVRFDEELPGGIARCDYQSCGGELGHDHILYNSNGTDAMHYLVCLNKPDLHRFHLIGSTGALLRASRGRWGWGALWRYPLREKSGFPSGTEIRPERRK
jgi:hypothetical protein